MTVLSKKTTVVFLGAAVSVLGLLGAGTAQASHDGGYGSGYGGDDFRAVSYINPDIGAATANPDVNQNSSCFNPDRSDNQQFSPAGTVTRNVHNDACFLDDRGNKVGNGIGATFESRGVGYISACPDPDGAGPQFARLSDTNGDGRNDRCTQSSYQDLGTVGVADRPGDFEYHARVNNNTATAGQQDVRWGLDRDLDGLDRRGTDDSITVNWSANGTDGGDRDYSYSGR